MNKDKNPFARLVKPDVPRNVVTQAVFEAATPRSLDYVFAGDLPNSSQAQDELVQGLLTSSGCSMVYGASNSGKTFLVIDLCAAISLGRDWMGRKTERGAVVYIAAESPVSVCVRLQALQRERQIKLDDLVVVKSPIDLFDSELDTESIIQLVQEIEKNLGKKVRLIVGDTLSRMAAGANENAGNDMGVIIGRLDRIKDRCAAHLLIVHHAGKAASAGARGWSGIRAAVDTEIEVTVDGDGNRVAEITKQRDLASGGQRIGFRLNPVLVAINKWGDASTTCLVTGSECVDKPKPSKKLGVVECAVMAAIAANGKGVTKSALVRSIRDGGAHEKGPIYRALSKLIDHGIVVMSDDLIELSQSNK